MFYLHSSNQTEFLAKSLATLIAEDRSPSLFRKELFLIQSRGMERMLAQYLSRTFGVWCNADYLTPLQFFDYLMGCAGIAVDELNYSRDLLTWQLEKILRRLGDSHLSTITTYLHGEQSALKRFQLARQLAHIFDQYQILRKDMLDAWDRGALVTGDESEVWQRFLWQRLREENRGQLHRGEIILEVTARLQSIENGPTRLPDRVFVFGLHTMPPLFLSALHEISVWTTIHLFLLSPCEMYWGDIESPKTVARRNFGGEQGGQQEKHSELAYHPLLVSLGRQGAHFQEMLLDLVDYQEGYTGFLNPAEDRKSSLLNRLQADILSGSISSESADNRIESDTSIQVISCHTRMRELAVLKDYVLSWLYENPSLQLHDIIVMAPDIHQYAQLIPAVFHDIQHTIADRNKRIENRYFDAFIKILEVFSGNYGWSELINILELKEVALRFYLSQQDLQKLREWVLGAGIRRGLSGKRSENDDYSTTGSVSWKSGLDRMLMGYAIDSEKTVAGILPFTEIEGSEGELLGKLCLFVDIMERYGELFALEKSLADWSHQLLSLSNEIFLTPDSPELLEVNRIISELNEIYSGYHQDPVSLQVITAWLSSALVTRSSGGFLGGKMTFCSMLPMRSVPFQIICLLGLNEGAFPKQDYLPTFDLMARDYRHGDRSSRADDRYQFLEALVAARQRLYISYIGQSIQTNEKIPPSVVVSELLDCLCSHYWARFQICHHPLQPSHKDYFSNNAMLFSYDEDACQISSNLQNRFRGSGISWMDPVSTQTAETRYDYGEIARFLVQPQIFYLRYILGIHLNQHQVLPDDDEEFFLDPLSQYLFDQKVTEALKQSVAPKAILERFQAQAHWPLGSPGLISFEQRVEYLETFVDRLTALDMGMTLHGFRFELSIDNFVLVGNLPHCFEHGQLLYRYAPLKGKDLLLGWLCHLVASRVRDQSFPTYIIASDCALCFKDGVGNDKDLRVLLTLFSEGCLRVSRLLVEPAFAYAQQYLKNQRGGRKNPLEVATSVFQKSIENNYVPEWTLVYRHQSTDQILNDEFESLCMEIMVPLLAAAQIVGETE